MFDKENRDDDDMGSCRVSCGSHSCYYNDFIQATDPGDLPPSVVYEKAENKYAADLRPSVSRIE